jgi:ATP-dependent protease ClpP protease subunit
VIKELSKLSNISDGVATIRIYKHIGDDADLGYGVNGAWIAEDIAMLNDIYKDEIKTINIRINSIGGSVADGLSIVSAILNSEIPCNTYIDGMAYSMAGVIAICGAKKYMADYGTFMMHNANGVSDEEVLNLITNSLAKIFERNTNLTMDKCKDLMNKETWMSADECMNLGIIDEIVVTKQKSIAMNSNIFELQNIYNKILNKTENKMIKLTELLKLSNEASEDSIVEAVNAKSETIANLEAKIGELTNELNALKESNEAAENAAKVELVENAIKEGKIDAATKEIYLVSNKSNVELKEVFAKLKPAYTPIFENKKALENLPAGRESWDFAKWSKEDPKALAEIQKNDPNTFNSLVAKMPKELSNNYNPLTDKRF